MSVGVISFHEALEATFQIKQIMELFPRFEEERVLERKTLLNDMLDRVSDIGLEFADELFTGASYSRVYQECGAE
jgi:hypothetical protein